MTGTRYPQRCPLARAAEVIGERWTLLVLRELSLGPRRFSDLRERLSGVSASVLSQRLAHLESRGVIRRGVLDPPAASAVYELTESGRALRPALLDLLRWGSRYLGPHQPNDRFEPEWLRLMLAAFARRGPTPARAFEIRVADEGRETAIHVAGGRKGTTVSEAPRPGAVIVTVELGALFALLGGGVSPSEALKDGTLRTEGDREALDLLPRLFDMKPA
jgi:DNA-binding HxlR family transcriptional regulator